MHNIYILDTKTTIPTQTVGALNCLKYTSGKLNMNPSDLPKALKLSTFLPKVLEQSQELEQGIIYTLTDFLYYPPQRKVSSNISGVI